MIRRKQKWYCTTCTLISEDAHLSAFNDYRLLFGEQISNKQAREFLKIESPYVTKHLLQKENYEYIGSTSGRKYKLVYKKVDIPKNNNKSRTKTNISRTQVSTSSTNQK